MKKLFALVIISTMVSCGLSDQEKKEIATITCNIIGESRKMDSALRIKEVNAAREQIGGDKFLLPDDVITAAFKHGLCEELILDLPKWEETLTEALRLEKEALDERIRIEKEKRDKEWAEAQRRLEESSRDFERQREAIRAREKNEAERVAREKEAKKQLEINNLKDWKQTLVNHFNSLEYSAASVSYSESKIVVEYECKSFSGFDYSTLISIKEGQEEVGRAEIKNSFGRCYTKNAVVRYGLQELGNELYGITRRANYALDAVEGIYIQINGVYKINGRSYEDANEKDKQLFPQHYEGLDSYNKLLEPIIIPLTFNTK